MKRKAFITLIIAVLIGVMLAGCGKKAEPAESENVVVEEKEPEETAEPEPEPEPEEPEELPPLPYVEENGLEFFQGTSFTTKAIRYNPETPEDYDVIDCNVEFTGVTVEDAEEDGYQTYIINTTSVFEIWESATGAGSKLTFFCPSFEAADMYTGRVVPGAILDGNVNEIQYRTELEWDGETYSIESFSEMRFEQGQWAGEFCPCYLYNTYMVTVPKEYDGLVIREIPVTEYEELEVGVIDETEKYLIDDEDGWKDGTILFSVNDLYRAFNGEQ